MYTNNERVLTYFKYDLEKLLDEFNTYYNIKHQEIPLYFRSIFLYFTNLSEIGLQTLLHANYNTHNAQELFYVLPSHLKVYTRDELLENMNQLGLSPIHYYGLFLFSYYFYETFLEYIKMSVERNLIELTTQIPNVETNALLLLEIIKRGCKEIQD